MKKQYCLKAYAFFLMACAVLGVCITVVAQDIPDPHGNFDEINRCRCKENGDVVGCYAGNAISLRPACAKSKDPIVCSNYNSNCTNAGGEGGTTN